MTSEQKVQLWIAGGFIALIIIITIIATVFSGKSSAAGSAFTAAQTAAVSSSDRTRGNASASVVITEYGDYECPACGAWDPFMDQLYQKYQDKVLFVFRNFPLYQIHPNAEISSQAAEAAGVQGKYWEMHALLYKNQDTWSKDTSGDVVTKYFDAYAQSLGLNVTQFNTDIDSTAVKNKIQADTALGNQANLDHTPTFFVNNVEIENPTSEQQFDAIIAAAIASSTAR